MDEHVEITPAIDLKISGKAIQDKESGKYRIQTEQCLGEWNASQIASINKFILTMEADSPEQAIEKLQEFCDLNDLELKVKESKQRGTKIKEIHDYFRSGKTVDEVIALGYHPATTKIQFKKFKQA